MASNNKGYETEAAWGEGLILGLMSGGLLLLVGFGVSLVWSPALWVGAAVAGLFPLLGVFRRRGHCPYCLRTVSYMLGLHEMNCHACQKKIEIRNRRLFRLD